jgi:hypothetical protein
MRLTVALASIITLGIGACTKDPLSPREFGRWISDPSHGLIVEHGYKDVALKVQYRPIAAMAIVEHREGLQQATLAEMQRERGGAFYFDLRIQATSNIDPLAAGTNNESDYYSRLFYFTSTVQDDIGLVVGSDTLPCALAHFERTYGTAPYNDLLLSFIDGTGRPLEHDLELIYHDRAYGLGDVSFIIRKDDILAIPELKLS